MTTKELSKLDEKELVALNNELSEKRAEFDAEIRAQQLTIQEEISRRQLRRRLNSLSKEERAELIKMSEEEDNG